MVNIDQQPAAILERNWFSDFLSGTYYYAEGIKPLISPYGMRNKGKVARQHHNSNRVEFYAIENIIDKIGLVVLKFENFFQFGKNQSSSTVN